MPKESSLKSSTLMSSLVLPCVVGVMACGETKLFATEQVDAARELVGPGGAAPVGPVVGTEADSPLVVSPAPIVPIVPSARIEPAESLYVEGGFLRDHCGTTLVLHGATEMVIWSEDRDGNPEFMEIAKTGANAVRIIWLLEASAQELDVVLSSARLQGLVPVLEFHDDFDDLSDAAALEEITSYLTAPEIVAVLVRHQKSLVIELEGKVWTESAPAEWARLFGHAIIDLRAAGIVAPIAVHEPSWDADLESVRKYVPAALAQDPLKNSLYAAAIWDGELDELRETVESLNSENVAVYISEFSGFETEDCPRTSFDVSSLLSLAFELKVGWFAWSWGGVANSTCGGFGFLDMTSDGTYEGLMHWGLQVAQTDRYSIAATTIPLATSNSRSCPTD